ncbi:hypothetical protein R3P38DRAFT_2850657 [Favolaschia claudopus]|uniref:Uncharacterized protein n=1 Tax=Favolaschia claudopus TaxID=2862362 RepID=A0AAW0DN60_9AGAR
MPKTSAIGDNYRNVRFDSSEDELLADFIAKQDATATKRYSQDFYAVLGPEASEKFSWSRHRPAKSWMTRYKNKHVEFDRRVQRYSAREHPGSSTPKSAAKTLRTYGRKSANTIPSSRQYAPSHRQPEDVQPLGSPLVLSNSLPPSTRSSPCRAPQVEASDELSPLKDRLAFRGFVTSPKATKNPLCLTSPSSAPAAAPSTALGGSDTRPPSPSTVRASTSMLHSMTSLFSAPYTASPPSPVHPTASVDAAAGTRGIPADCDDSDEADESLAAQHARLHRKLSRIAHRSKVFTVDYAWEVYTHKGDLEATKELLEEQAAALRDSMPIAEASSEPSDPSFQDEDSDPHRIHAALSQLVLKISIFSIDFAWAIYGEVGSVARVARWFQDVLDPGREGHAQKRKYAEVEVDREEEEEEGKHEQMKKRKRATRMAERRKLRTIFRRCWDC